MNIDVDVSLKGRGLLQGLTSWYIAEYYRTMCVNSSRNIKKPARMYIYIYMCVCVCVCVYVCVCSFRTDDCRPTSYVENMYQEHSVFDG